jgi:YcxB-like protein
MNVDFHLTQKDFIEAYRLNAKNKRNYLILFTTLFISLFFAIILMFYKLTCDQKIILMLLFVMFNTISIFLIGCVLPLCDSFDAKKIWRSNPLLRNKTYVEFDSNGFKITTMNYETFLKWDMYIGWTETSNTYMLFLDGGIFNIIPKYAFEDSILRDDFVEILLVNIKSKPRNIRWWISLISN